MTKLAPARMMGLVMGVWFLASAAGNFIGGLIARATGGETVDAASGQIVEVYSRIGWVAVGVGVAVILVSPLIRKLMHENVRQDHALAGQQAIGEPAAVGIPPGKNRG
jgi:POT family proton-dependent oligopeptide transporter